MKVKFKKKHPDAKLPTYGTAGAAGADVYAVQEMEITGHCHALIPTGLDCEIEPGYEMQVRPRSGLAFKNKITVLNSPGTIDEDYRGELCVMLMNHGTGTFKIEKGDRIAQIVIAPVVRANFEFVEELSDTARGAGGFGSTGVK